MNYNAQVQILLIKGEKWTPTANVSYQIKGEIAAFPGSCALEEIIGLGS